jgi:hypothetical protein
MARNGTQYLLHEKNLDLLKTTVIMGLTLEKRPLTNFCESKFCEEPGAFCVFSFPLEIPKKYL